MVIGGTSFERDARVHLCTCPRRLARLNRDVADWPPLFVVAIASIGLVAPQLVPFPLLDPQSNGAQRLVFCFGNARFRLHREVIFRARFELAARFSGR